MAKKQMALFVVASVADLAATLWGTALTGYGSEYNPIARAILVAGGPLGLGVYKLGGVCVVLVLIALLAGHRKTWVRLTASLLLLLGTAVAAIGAWSWLPFLSSVYF